MNNRFRFRVFDKEKNNYVDDSEVELILHNDGVLLFGNWHEDIKVVEQDKYIIEQCTGLKDKNGNLIYEGDIVKCDRDFDPDGRVNLTKEVIFTDGSFTLANLDPKNRDFCYINRFHNIEIIGNIHEQTEQKDK